ncbi:MAG: hypothetical protein IKJ58_09850 [Akkermansia sp.]|nr:hypothetical protein [Akkermansia sp.]
MIFSRTHNTASSGKRGGLLSTLCLLLFTASGLLNAQTIESPTETAYPRELICCTEDEDGTLRLLIPVARYMDNCGRIVDLVGAVHLADEAYYRNLNRAFPGYDYVLYELVDGEDVPELSRLSKKIENGTATPEERRRFNQLVRENLSRGNSAFSQLLGQYYATMAEKLELSLQTECIDYSLNNMVYADMSTEELDRAMEERGETWMQLILASLMENGSGGSLFAFSAEALRREMIEFLAESDSRDVTMENSAIVISRNIRCMEVLDRVVRKASPDTRIAIFYGAMHLRDMHQRMLERGFTLQGVQWMTAIRS